MPNEESRKLRCGAEYRLREGADIGFDDPGNPIALQAVLDAQHDVQAAVRWLRANAATYRLDPSRIAIGGSSAGAGHGVSGNFDQNAVDIVPFLYTHVIED